jgi:hypothetical protein
VIVRWPAILEYLQPFRREASTDGNQLAARVCLGSYDNHFLLAHSS